MKFSSYAAAALAAGSVQGAAIEKRQIPGFPLPGLGPITAQMGLGGKVNYKGKTAAEVQELKAQIFPELNSRRVKIRYGPYEVPSVKKGAIGRFMDGEGGMAWNMPDKNVRKPCTDCMLTYMKAGLESPAGELVNTNDGLWLHHMVAINGASDLADATCKANPISLPHIGVMSTSQSSERFFASGNERTEINLKNIKGKAGYRVKKGDEFSFIIELMNMNVQPKTVFMTIEYEYVPGVPEGFSHAKPIWLDAFQCGLSDVHPKSEVKPFTWSSPTYVAEFAGDFLGMGAHLHDGGISAQILKNDKVICDSKAAYGETPEYRSQRMMMKGGKMNVASNSTETEVLHISSQSACYNTDANLGKLNIGDRLDMVGYYDYKQRPGMPREDGKQSDVMVIGIIYIAVPPNKR